MRFYRRDNGWLECEHLVAVIIVRGIHERKRVRIIGTKLLRHAPTKQTKVILKQTKLFFEFRARQCMIGGVIELPQDVYSSAAQSGGLVHFYDRLCDLSR